MQSSTIGNDKSDEDKIVFRQLLLKMGPEEITIWFEELAKHFRRLPESLTKKQLCAVFDKDMNHTPLFKDLQTIMNENDLTNKEHGKALETAMSKEISLETINLPSARSRSHAIIIYLLGPCAKGLASADPKFRENDELTNPDPVATVRALKRIFITEREGTGSAQKVAAKAAAINDLLTMHKNSNPSGNESLIDFREKLVRRINGIKNSHGIDAIPHIFETETEMVLFFVFHLDSKYAQLQRDIENKIISAPMTLDEAVTMAKDRVEVTKKTRETVVPVSVFTTVERESPSTTRATKTTRVSHRRSPQVQGPLDPYPHMSTDEFSALPDHQKLEIKRHHSAIRTAARTLKKTIANNRAGRSTLATIHTPKLEETEVSIVMISHETFEAEEERDRDPKQHDASLCPNIESDDNNPPPFIRSGQPEPEEFEESYVMMSYELPQESERETTEAPSDSEEDFGETAPLQLEAEHGDIMEPNQASDTATGNNGDPVPDTSNTPPLFLDGRVPDNMPDTYPNYPNRVEPHDNVYRMINVCHSIFDSQDIQPSYWYCIGGPNNDNIFDNHELARSAAEATAAHPPGHIQGFQSHEVLQTYRTEARRNLAIIRTDRANHTVHAWADGNMIMVQLYPQTGTGSYRQIIEEAAIYNTLPTSHTGDNTPTNPNATSYPYGRITYDMGSDNLPLPDPGPTAQSAHHRHPFNPNWPTSNVEIPVIVDNTPRHQLLSDDSGGGSPLLRVNMAIWNENNNPDPRNMAYITRRATIIAEVGGNANANVLEETPQDVPPPLGIGVHNNANDLEEPPQPQAAPSITTRPARPKYKPWRTPK